MIFAKMLYKVEEMYMYMTDICIKVLIKIQKLGNSFYSPIRIVADKYTTNHI